MTFFRCARSMAMTQDRVESSPTRRRRSAPSPSRLLPLAVACSLLALLPIRPASSLYHPLTREVRKAQTECIYQRLERGDFATFEIFIVDADDDGRPATALQIEGPVVANDIGKIDESTGERTWDPRVLPGANAARATNDKTKLGALMQDWLKSWPQTVKKNHQRFQELGIIHHGAFVDYTHAGDHEDAIAARADASRDGAREGHERLHRNIKKYTGNESADDEIYEEEGKGIETVVPDLVEAYEWTKPIKTPGWYRMCVTPPNLIVVEMDIRSGADLGGINPDTWHVYTHDEREEMEEKERILGSKEKGPSAEEVEANLVAKELENALKDQVKGYDLETTRQLLDDASTMVSKILTEQRKAHKRIKSHENDAGRNRRRIGRSGMIQTGLYLAITLFQVYTVHKWLLGSNMLGR